MADPEEGGTHRWGAEITIVGEFVLGTGPTTGCGQTVWPETTGGLLSSHVCCHFSFPAQQSCASISANRFVHLFLRLCSSSSISLCL
jgi:hypothetical protein